jgi:hypothetical protein
MAGVLVMVSQRRASQGSADGGHQQPYGRHAGGDESTRVLSVVNVGEVSVSIEVNRLLSEDEVKMIGDRSIEDAQICKSSGMDNEQCAVTILEDVVAVVKAFGDVDVGQITVKFSDITISKQLFP